MNHYVLCLFFGWIPRYRQWMRQKSYRAYVIAACPFMFTVIGIFIHINFRDGAIELLSQVFDKRDVQSIIGVAVAVLSLASMLPWFLAMLEARSHMEEWYERLFKR